MTSCRLLVEYVDRQADCLHITATVVTREDESADGKIISSSNSHSSNSSQTTSSQISSQNSQMIIDSSQKQSKEQDRVHVRATGIWKYTAVSQDNLIHVIDASIDKETKCLLVDNNKGLLVVDPDNLLTCTTIAAGLWCSRKAWLNTLLPGQFGTTKALLTGTLVHEVYQYGVKNRLPEKSKLIKYLDEELLDDATNMIQIYSIQSDITEIRDAVIEYINSISEWICKYMLLGPPHPLENDKNLEAKIIGIHDIEENVWSTKYGLKGKIDVTGNVRINDRSTKTVYDQILPIELKTGKPGVSNSHSAQVSLYSLMIEDRYKQTNRGLLLYLKDKPAMHAINVNNNSKRDLINRRNELNNIFKDLYQGPDMLDERIKCKSCDSLSHCIYMSEVYRPGSLENHETMKSLRSDAVGHLSDHFLDFFKKRYEALIVLKAEFDNGRIDASSQVINKDPDAPLTDSQQQSKHFWTYSSKEAEARGIGISKLVARFKPGSNSILIFKRQAGSLLLSNGNGKLSFQQTQPFNIKTTVARGRVAVSLDNESIQNLSSTNSQTALVIGTVLSMTENEIVFRVFESVEALLPLEKKIFRLDSLTKRLQLDIEKATLSRLLNSDDWTTDDIRSFLSDPLYKMDFGTEFTAFILEKNFDYILKLDGEYQKLLTEAVATDNYYMFDTICSSKMSLKQLDRIVSMITKVILGINRTVLIVSELVDELDDLMLSLKLMNINFILLDDGKSVSVRNKFSDHLVKVPQDSKMSVTEKYYAYTNKIDQATVVITSYAMASAGYECMRKQFDYSIMYDCNCVELLLSLGPMFCSRRWIMLLNPTTSQEFVKQATPNGSNKRIKLDEAVVCHQTGDTLISTKKETLFDIMYQLGRIHL